MSNVVKPKVLVMGTMTGRKQTGTNIVISVGRDLVAFANLGGKWSEEQGLKEFKKGNKKFTIREKMAPVAELIRRLP